MSDMTTFGDNHDVPPNGYTMTNYFYQAAIAVEMMEEWLAENPEQREAWEEWDWL